MDQLAAVKVEQDGLKEALTRNSLGSDYAS
jgi:hypothetical protein